MYIMCALTWGRGYTPTGYLPPAGDSQEPPKKQNGAKNLFRHGLAPCGDALLLLGIGEDARTHG